MISYSNQIFIKLLKFFICSNLYYSEYLLLNKIFQAYEPSIPNYETVYAQPESDIIVLIRVYVPFTSRHKQSTGALGKLSVNTVIAILGSQTLDKLRDQISCISDFSISTEMSNNPTSTEAPNAKVIFIALLIF